MYHRSDRTGRGTGQGSVISPLLANIYLDYVLDLWAECYRRREAKGDMIVVRYADDFIVGFEHEEEAVRFLDALKARFEEFALALNPEKTRLIAFGRFAAERRKERGLGKPDAHATQPERSHSLGPDDEVAGRMAPKPRILHPWPSQRFIVRRPRREPYAGKPHVRFCAGGA
ncbi:MAG TPA: reverse transcriptase/maturase family protein [Rhizomicrobium sp.]